MACRSRMCLVRKYNKENPDEYHVDFFIFSDSNDYNILNLNVYQGDNSVNVLIDERTKVFPTTTKIVLNSMYKLQFDILDGSNGYHHWSMYNRYECPELAMILRQQYNIYLTGTVKINRKGYPRYLFTRTKSSVKCEYEVDYDKMNKFVCLK